MRSSLVASMLVVVSSGCSPSPPANVSAPRVSREASDRSSTPGAVAVSMTAFESLGDSWVGGFGPIDGTGGFAQVDFAEGTLRLRPGDDATPLGIVRPTVVREASGREVFRFVVYEQAHRWSFDLWRAGDDALEGTATDAKAGAASVRLVRAEAPDRATVDVAFGGTYAVHDDPRRLLLVERGRLFDTRDGTDRRLFLLRGRRALVGSGVGTTHPPLGIARLDDTTLTIEGSSKTVATRFAVKKEEVQFTSDGVTLQGTLTSPPGSGPFPTAVFVHGSGHSSRKDPWENAMARVLVSEGYALFLYDKRGVGDSGGEYVGRGGRETNNVSKANLEQLARDARAAFAAVTARSDVDGRWVGFVGLSQAGWIVPLAATGNERVRFVIMVSTPTVPVGVQLAYQTLNGDAVNCLPLSESARITHDHAPKTGVDPGPAIAALNVSGLWLYGASDPLIPFTDSMSALERMKKRDFTVKLVPNAGHELWVVTHDTEEERQLAPGMSPVAIETLHAWLRSHAPTTRAAAKY